MSGSVDVKGSVKGGCETNFFSAERRWKNGGDDGLRVSRAGSEKRAEMSEGTLVTVHARYA